MNIHAILGCIAILLGIYLLWLWTRPRVENRSWLKSLFFSVSIGFLYGGAIAVFPWFKEHVDSPIGLLIALGLGAFTAVFRVAVRYLEKGFRAR